MKLSNEVKRTADAVGRLEAQLKAYKKAVSKLMYAADTNPDFQDMIDTVGPISNAVNTLYWLNNEVDRQGE